MAQASSKQPGRKAGPAPGDRHEAEPQGGLRLLVDGLPGLSGLPCLAEPLDPQTLASFHPLWARDVAALGPWCLEPGQGKSDPVWLPGTLPGGSEGADVVVCGPCTSTMDVARELAGRSGLRPWASVITPIQTGGRGQLRRAWLSAPGNVLATLVCPPAEGLWNDLRPLVLGHLLAEALMDEYPGVEVKWPNDLLLDGRKIGGILVEERPGLVLAGLGLNLAWAPDAASLREGAYVPAGVFPARAGGPCLLYTSPSPRDRQKSRMPSSA